MLYLLVFFSSLIITIFSTPFLINFLTRLNIVDVPGGRRINTHAIPRMGGILIYAIIVIALINYTSDFSAFRLIIFSSGLLALCGILDDLRELKWPVKFMLHSLSAGVILLYLFPMINNVEFFGSYIPFPFDVILIFIFITGSINALNMLDGMDGLVSGFSLLLFMLLFILSFSVGDSFLMVLSAACIGSLIGFLKFNANPARIFLGDTGSLLLGFFLVLSSLLFSIRVNAGTLDLGFSVILLGVPLIDTLRVITVRIWNGRSPFIADNNHIHHMISGNNVRHKTTVFIIQVFTLFFIMLSLVYLYRDKFTAYVLFCISGALLFNLSNMIPVVTRFKKLSAAIVRLVDGDIVTIDLYKKYILPVSALMVAGVLLLFFPNDVEMPADIIALLLVICALLFMVSYISRKRENKYSDLYILMNLIIFFSLTTLSKSWESYSTIFQSRLFLYAAAFSITAVIALFILTKDKLYHDGRVLITGLDMIMLVLFVFLFFVKDFFPEIGVKFIDRNLLVSFTIYIWYKVLVFVIPKMTRPAYYVSFGLPFITLIFISI